MAIRENSNSPSPTNRGANKPQSPNHNEIHEDTHASSGLSAANRKRTARACDRCSTARTKCDGKQPCYRCLSKYLLCYF